MSGLIEGLSLLTTLVQAANHASAAAVDLAALLSRARAEGREPSDAELDEARNAAKAALAKL